MKFPEIKRAKPHGYFPLSKEYPAVDVVVERRSRAKSAEAMADELDRVMDELIHRFKGIYLKDSTIQGVKLELRRQAKEDTK